MPDVALTPMATARRSSAGAANHARSSPDEGAGAQPRAGGRARRWLASAVRFLLLGAALNVAVAFALALLVDVSQGGTESADSWTGRDHWTVTRWSRTGATYILSSHEVSPNWSPAQATGAPDTPGGGDRVTAWASATSDGQAEWLVVEFPEAVVPASVRVYETCSGGALTKVGVFRADGEEVEAWGGTDPTPQGASLGTSEIPLRADFPTKKVKLYVDSARVPGWNEVDAVELVGRDGKGAWAVEADASSVYGARFSAAGAATGDPSSLAPRWSRLDRSIAKPPPGVRTVQHAVEARGWPVLTLSADAGSKQIPVAAQGPFGGGTRTLSGSPGSGAVMASTVFLYPGVSSTAAGGLEPVPGKAALPLRPIWKGFLANTCFYAVVLFALYWALTAPLRFVREVSRLRRGCCVACGYDLGFEFVPGCPECGWRRGGHAGMTGAGATPGGTSR